MKFSIVVNMARFDTTKGMDQVAAEALDLVKIADQGGFDIVWTAEHHTIELTISPNPFQLLAHWGQSHQKRASGHRRGRRALLEPDPPGR